MYQVLTSLKKVVAKSGVFTVLLILSFSTHATNNEYVDTSANNTQVALSSQSSLTLDTSASAVISNGALLSSDIAVRESAESTAKSPATTLSFSSSLWLFGAALVGFVAMSRRVYF